MSGDDQIELGHQNLISYSRTLAGWGSKGTLQEADGSLCFASGSWLPVGGNGAFRLDDDLNATELVTRADAFFGGIGRGYGIKVRDDGADDDLQSACEAQGLTTFGDPVPQMICRQPLAVTMPPSGIALRPVTTVEGVFDFVAVNTEAYATYGMPDDVLADIFDRPEQVVADDDTHLVVAYRGERPVAAALTYMAHGVGALQWVGTVSEARRLRLGQLVTEWGTNRAFECGATSCTLQASPMGAPLYAKLGYQTIYHYREFIRWAVPPS
jgi:GNAT acetyltransferase-like protein